MRRILRRFYYGFAGLAHVVRSEWNMRFHLVAAAGAIAACAWFRVSAMEWMLVLIVIALVLAAECINTGIERLADRVCKEDDPLIKQCKDASAAGVTVMAILAMVVAAIIFVPHVIQLLPQ